MQAPVGRIFFTGEHTSEKFNGYVHGGYSSGKQNITNSSVVCKDDDGYDDDDDSQLEQVLILVNL